MQPSKTSQKRTPKDRRVVGDPQPLSAAEFAQHEFETLRSEFGGLYAVGKMLMMLCQLSHRDADLALMRVKVLNDTRKWKPDKEKKKKRSKRK